MASEGGGLPHPFHYLPAFHIPALPGAPEAYSYAVSFSFLAMGLILFLALLTRLALNLAPGRVQNLLEWLMEIVEEQGKSIFGEHAVRFMPFYITVFLFILTSNLMGLIPGMMSPTASYHTNIAMALSVLALTQWGGVRVQGLKGYLKHFLPPPCPWWLKWTIMWWMWPLLEVLSQVIRPVSLTMRLFGNIYAKEKLLLIFAFLAVTFWGSSALGMPLKTVLAGFSVVLRVGIILLGTLVSIVQAAVFTILAMVYVSMAVEHHEEPQTAEGGH